MNISTPTTSRWRIPATILSYVLHPVFMPVYITLALYRLLPGQFVGFGLRQFVFVVLTTIFYPLFTLLLLRGLGFVKSFMLEDPKERIIPLIATMIFYFWGYQVSKGNGYPELLRVMLLGAFWNVIVLFMINIFFKVSLHAAGMGGLLGMLFIAMRISHANLVLPFCAALALAGLLGTARLVLGAHHQSQVWAGYVIGFGVQWAAYSYLT